jgi:hypothetical protein
MAKQDKSRYKSKRSTAQNKPVYVLATDPNLLPENIDKFRRSVGSEIIVVGTNGLPLSFGGTSVAGPPRVNADPPGAPPVVYPGSPGSPPYIGGIGAVVIAGITDVSTAWSGTSLVVTFDWDYENSANQGVTEFVLEITTSEGLVRRTPFGTFPVNRTQTAQTLTLTKSLNRSTIGIFRTNITSVCVYAMDAFYNKSSDVCDTTVPAYVVNLPVPTITVNPAISGYNVSYTVPTEDELDAIDIVEYESNASTEPTGVTYSRVYFDTVSPANVITTNTNPRWVKARFSSDSGVYTAFSAAQSNTNSSSYS